MRLKRSLLLFTVVIVFLAAVMLLAGNRWSDVSVVHLGYAAPDESHRMVYESAPGSGREGEYIWLETQVQYAGFTEGDGSISDRCIRKALGADLSAPQAFTIRIGHDSTPVNSTVMGYWQKRYEVIVLTQTRTGRDGQIETRTVTAYVPVEPMLQLHYYTPADAPDGDRRLRRVEYFEYMNGAYTLVKHEDFP